MFQETFKLNKDEHVVIYVRRHWIFLMVEIFRTTLLFLLPALLFWALQIIGLTPQFEIFGVTFDALTNILIYMWGIFCWLWIAEKFTDYALDFWIVTDKRIVESELRKLFDRQLSTLELQDIEDITIRNEGFWANYFGYGTLEVQTAGSRNEFLADKIADPERVQQIMFDLKLKDEREKKHMEFEDLQTVTQKIVKDDLESFNHIPNDQKIDSENNNSEFDWAHVNESQAKDLRNIEEKIEEIEDKYKKDVDSAIRSE